MGYVIGHGLQIPEEQISLQSNIRLQRYQMSKSGKLTTLAITFFIFLIFLNSVTNMATNYHVNEIENKSLCKENRAMFGIWAEHLKS